MYFYIYIYITLKFIGNYYVNVVEKQVDFKNPRLKKNCYNALVILHIT